MERSPLQRFVIMAVTLLVVCGGFKVRDWYEASQPMPDVPLIDEKGVSTSLQNLLVGSPRLCIVFLPPSMGSCPGIQAAGRVACDVYNSCRSKARFIGIAENATPGGIQGVRQGLSLPFPVYVVAGKQADRRPLMNALSTEVSAFSRTTVAGAFVVLDPMGQVVHRAPEGKAEPVKAFLQAL